MKNALQLCSLALNPIAPSPTASMVRISDGFIESFGGTFAIRVPVHVEVGACFNPALAATFFRKERKLVAYTLAKNKLVFQEGKEKLSLPFLPPEEMVTLDVLSRPRKVKFDMTHLKTCADIVDPANSRMWAQGISFRAGMMEATNNALVVSAVTDFPDEFEFNLPQSSAKALLRFKSEVTGIAIDQQSVKFCFADGSSLTSLVICEQMIETAPFYRGEWTPLALEPETAKDLLSIACESVEFKGGTALYLDGHMQGEITGVASKVVAVHVGKPSLDTLLQISADLRLSDDGQRLMAVSASCRAIASTRAHHSANQ